MRQLLVRILIHVGNAYRRCLVAYCRIVGPRAAYATLATPARWLYALVDPVRLRCEAQCRAALGDSMDADSVKRLAQRAFVHRYWNLLDLMLADRMISRSNHARFGGRIPQPYRDLLLDAHRRHQPIILLTAYYGPYDLLPLFLGYNGVRAGAVYRHHPNASYDAFRRQTRGRSGCELIPVEQAISRMPEILDAGGAVAILADHHTERRGVPVTFLGQPTGASRAVGILAERFSAIIAVAAIHRLRTPFTFEIVVSDLFGADSWRDEADPVTYITRRYVRAIESIIARDPAQYLWSHDRWHADPRPT
ncbi:MAG: lysophospholipid acyltransferase family protein [Phycisphaerae bacterium]|nr:lysophospholipid acyltransferase family protein [Phycisphaerae bacterium]